MTAGRMPRWSPRPTTLVCVLVQWWPERSPPQDWAPLRHGHDQRDEPRWSSPARAGLPLANDLSRTAVPRHPRIHPSESTSLEPKSCSLTNPCRSPVGRAVERSGSTGEQRIQWPTQRAASSTSPTRGAWKSSSVALPTNGQVPIGRATGVPPLLGIQAVPVTQEQAGPARRRDRPYPCGFPHKTSTQLVREFDLIGIEDLRLCAMVRKGRGKRGLNRVMHAAAVGRLAGVGYEGLAGIHVIKVNPAYTSQRCRQCGHMHRKTAKAKRCSGASGVPGTATPIATPPSISGTMPSPERRRPARTMPWRGSKSKTDPRKGPVLTTGGACDEPLTTPTARVGQGARNPPASKGRM